MYGETHLSDNVQDALAVQFRHAVGVVLAGIVSHSDLDLLHQSLEYRVEVGILGHATNMEAGSKGQTTNMDAKWL